MYNRFRLGALAGGVSVPRSSRMYMGKVVWIDALLVQSTLALQARKKQRKSSRETYGQWIATRFHWAECCIHSMCVSVFLPYQICSVVRGLPVLSTRGVAMAVRGKGERGNDATS